MDRAVPRRPGTSGISGHLFETKSLALYLFRLQHDPTVQYFRIAANIKGFGAFDDICLVVKIEGHDRPFALFVQLKHKEDDKAVIKFDNKDKLKYVTSYLKITKRIASPQPQEDFLDLNLNETDCFFILFTNAKFKITNTESKFENSYAPVFNSLLATSDAVGCRVQESDQVVEDFGDYFLKSDLVLLSKHFVEFLIDKGSDRSLHIMNNEYVQQYHVILRQKVVDVSDIQTVKGAKWRTMTFKRDFFTTNDKNGLIFKDQLLKELLKNHREILSLDSKISKPSLDKTISLFLNAPSAATLTPLIITHIDCNEVGELEFIIKRPSHDVKLLQQTNISRKEIDEAILAAETSAMEYLLSLELKVPITFGNVDLAIRGSDKKVNSRLEYLTTAVCGLCKEYQLKDQYKIVIIDDDWGDGLLSHNGGLASAVGNMFTYDGITNMMMFSTNFTCEQMIAKQLLLNLKNQISDMSEYRFVIKTKRFPKLNFDCTDTARGFISKLIIYETQGNHWEVENILKENIQKHLTTDSWDPVMNYSDTGVSVFLHYHEEILKWWISPTMYLNETTNLYEQAILNMKAEPQISALQTYFYISKAKYFKIGFTKNAMKWTELPKPPSKMFVTTDTVALTTVKVVQCFKRYLSINNLAVLDVENVLNLSIAGFNSLNEEIKNTEKVLIIMWHETENYDVSDNNRLSTLAQVTKDKQSVVIINSEYKEIINKLFKAQDVFYHETETLLNIEPQIEIPKHAKVVFQGQEVTLEKILDDKSVAFVKGGIIDTVIRNETINIGQPLSTVQYEEVKDLYVDRRVSLRDDNDYKYDLSSIDDITSNFSQSSTESSDDDGSSIHKYISDRAVTKSVLLVEGDPLSNIQYEEVKDLYVDDDNSTASSDVFCISTYNSDKAVFLVKTFLDIRRRVVLLTAPPGMGKTTLLTHLSLKTKQHDVNLWIVRMDFRDYSKQFHKWYKDAEVLNDLKALNLLCQVILRNKTMLFNIVLTHGEAHLLSGTHNELADFELSMFLHFYNQSRVIFLFDGFDEICPYYKDKVIRFLSVVKYDLRKHRMWVTSRPYSEILPDLETVLGPCLELECFTFTEQETYLRRFWEKKLLLIELSEKQLENLQTFLNITRESISKTKKWIRIIYSVFVDTVRPLVCETTSDTEIDKLNAILNTARIQPKSEDFRLSGIPLLLYFLADYFVNKVDQATNRHKAILEFNLHNIYETFIENKVKTVLFQDKIKLIDLTNTFTRGLLEKELHDRISIHKKLAAYTFYQASILRFHLEELKDMEPLNEQEYYAELNKVKTGTEKTGLISQVNSDDVPVFLHRSFEEYFIAEYVCDIIKSDRFKLFQKVILYCAATAVSYTADEVQDWIERKKEADPTLRNAFLEMEKTSPIYTTKYRLYLNRDIIRPNQYLRILASSVNDYEDGCFTEYGEKFKNFNEFSSDVMLVSPFTNILTNYLIFKMKPQLKLHFGGPTLFVFRHNDVFFYRDFIRAEIMKELNFIRLNVKVRGHKRLVPLFMLLTHQDHCDTFELSNTESMSENCQELLTDDIVQTDFVNILIPQNNYPRCLSYVSDASFSSMILNFLDTTSIKIIGNRLLFSEKHVEEIAEETLVLELKEIAVVVVTILEKVLTDAENIGLTHGKLKVYHVFLRQHVFDVTDIQTDESNPTVKWRTVTFRDDFFYTEDKLIKSLRNCLFEVIFSSFAASYLFGTQFFLDQLIQFFFAEPSATTLTLLLGAGVIGLEDNKLTFLLNRPDSDVKQLRNINIPQSMINEAKLAVRTATEIYLRSLLLKVPIEFGNIDLPSQSLNDYPLVMNNVELKSAIVKLCEQNKARKVVMIDNSLGKSLSAQGGLASCVGNILIYDGETEMLKVQHLDQLTAAQENAKSLYLQLSREIADLHEYRFQVRTEKLPRCHLDFKYLVKDFLKRLIIFAEESIDYELNKIVFKERYFLSSEFVGNVLKQKLGLLHFHSEVLKWWKTSNTCTNQSDLYQLAAKNFNLEPIISQINASFYSKNLECFKKMSSENVTNYIEPVGDSKTMVVTKTVKLTTINILLNLRSRGFNNDYTVLDLELMRSTLTYREDRSLRTELRDTKKVLIVVWTQMRDDVLLRELTELLKHKSIVIIADNEFRATVESHRELFDVMISV